MREDLDNHPTDTPRKAQLSPCALSAGPGSATTLLVPEWPRAGWVGREALWAQG
jgi:hypothetical protein